MIPGSRHRVELTTEDGAATFDVGIEPAGGGGFVVLLRDISHRMRVDRLRGRFLNRLAHDIRTPQTSAMLMIDLIAGGDLPEQELVECVETLREQNRREQEIVEELLRAGRLEASGIELTPAPVDLVSLMKDVAGVAATYAAQLDVELRVDLGETLSPVVGDAEALRAAFDCVIDNALEFSAPGGEVMVGVAGDTRGVAVHVRDSGMGIREQDLPHVFEMYFRGENLEADKHPGAGLGLYTTRRVVEGLGGRVKIESVLGEGTMVEMWLPFAATVEQDQ